MSRLVSLLGIAVILGILFALSRNRKAISWRLVITGLLIQGVLGLCFLRWEAGREGIFSFGEGVKAFLDLSKEGSLFIFGPLVEFQMVEGAFASADPEVVDRFRAGGMRDVGFVFATQVLPTLIFFSSTPSSRCVLSATEANASLTSQRSTSSGVLPIFSRALIAAGAGTATSWSKPPETVP